MIDHIRGNANAPVALLEYGDYQCPYCKAAQPLLRRLRRLFGKNLSLTFRHFPITQIHRYALRAAEAAEAAGRQKKFWQMHDALFATTQSASALGDPGLRRIARKAGLDMKAFSADINDKTLRAEIRKEFLAGARAGVNGTPTFFINGRRYDGEHEFQAMAEAIQRALDKKTKGKKK